MDQASSQERRACSGLASLKPIGFYVFCTKYLHMADLVSFRAIIKSLK
jgi:hypothetical protein